MLITSMPCVQPLISTWAPSAKITDAVVRAVNSVQKRASLAVTTSRTHAFDFYALLATALDRTMSVPKTAVRSGTTSDDSHEEEEKPEQAQASVTP